MKYCPFKLAAILLAVLSFTLSNSTADEPVVKVPNGSASPIKTPPQDALQTIEGVRGGRHWVDAKTAPPKSPQESLACLQIEPGFKIELIAAEPLVRDPVAIAFDQHGQIFVVEYGDYPTGPTDGSGKPLSRVVLLTDTDGDGRLDQRHVFADKLTFAHSLMPYRNGLLVGAQTAILFLQDTDGDHKADVREVLFDGFTPAHPQMQIGNPRWGIDNRIYFNYGPGKVASQRKPEQRVTLPRKDFSFNPQTMEFAADSGMGQFGNTVDRWGQRFYCTNRNPIITTMFPPAVARRNPFATIDQASYDVAPSGGDTRVYPLVKMKSNYLSHAGTHTAACGVTAYTGDAFGAEFDNSVFVCEPIGHLVTRLIVTAEGPRLVGQRARDKADFVASTDTWFRPASLANGPDGALYLADMYRLWVEHPKFLPPDVAAKLDWRAGEDRGRIYRIIHDGQESRPFQTPQSTAEIVALLNDPNGWRQFLGQRLLVEKQDPAAAALLRRVLQTSKSSTARLHALWTLDGLHDLQADDVRSGMQDLHPQVRRAAVELSPRFLDQADILRAVCLRVHDEDARVRLQTAVALGESDSETATAALSELAVSDGRDPWFARAILTSSKHRAGEILLALLNPTGPGAKTSSEHVQFVKQLATVVGTRGDVAELGQVLTAVTADEPRGLWWRAAIIAGLGDGLPRHRGPLGRVTLTQLIAKPPAALTDQTAELQEMLQTNQQAALDRKRELVDRVAAVELLAFQPFATSSTALSELLASDQPPTVQAACLGALERQGSPEAAQIVLARWQQLGPAIRSRALAFLLRRTDSTRLVLNAMEAGEMRASSLDIDQRVRLLKHSDAKIRAQATKLLGGTVSANRRAVVATYESAVAHTGSAREGAKVFAKICANCHRIDGQGFEAGPDISDVRNRSRAAILYDVLDPNAKVEPRFTAYNVLTDDGKTFSGLIVTESPESIVLKMAAGKQETITRQEIVELKSSKISLMPEGIEKDVTVEQMTDLLEFLTNRPPGLRLPDREEIESTRTSP